MPEIGETAYLWGLIVASILSLIGCSILIFQYFKQRPNANFALKLLAILSISNVIYVVATIMDPIPKSDDALCVFQAFLKQAAGLSTFIVNFFLCYTTYLAIVQGSEIEDDRYTKAVKVLSIPFPYIVALIPLCYQGYGIHAFACAFKSSNYYWIGGLFFFYIPFISLLFGSLRFVTKIFSFLKEVSLHKSAFDDLKVNRITLMAQKSYLSEGKLYTSFLLYYTVAHMICWVPSLLYEIIVIFGIDLLWLNGLRYIFACSQGLFNALIFLWSKAQPKNKQIYDVRDSIASDASAIDIYRGSVTVYNSSL